jgi:hypothetical protein
MANRNQTFESPRGQVFGTKTQMFEIVNVDRTAGLVEVEFKKKPTRLRLEFWRFNTALDLLKQKKGELIRLGTRFVSDEPDTIEYILQKKARQIHPNRKIDLKSAPHICDILVLSGKAKYEKALNPATERENQAIRLKTA